MCGVVRWGLSRRFEQVRVSKRAYARTNEGDWCENHGYNSSHFRRRPLGAEEEEEEEGEEDEQMDGLIVFCQ